MSADATGRRVVVVTGGGGGIGAAIAMELGRRGDHVVTVDPLVSVDGTEQLGGSEPTTTERIVAAGGSAQTSAASVTDPEAMTLLADELVQTHGRIDAVVNVAGITRPTGFAKGAEHDWSAVLSVHLDGYRNLLEAVLGHMAAAGRGHVVGVTSGSGWRAADAGAYSCAKRAVASLTWQLGRATPPGVAVNAISPIAMTRMVAAALGRSGASAAAAAAPGGSSATGGLSLGSMPEPEHLAPLGASLAGHGAAAVTGRVLFTCGSEVAVVDPPRLLEVVRTAGAASVGAVVDAFVETLATAQASQSTGGGANPRFAGLFDLAGSAPHDRPMPRTVIVTDRPDLGAAIAGALDDALAGSGAAIVVPAGSDHHGSGPTALFGAARDALAAAAGAHGPLDSVVVALATPAPARTGTWDEVLSSHAGLSDWLLRDAAWARAAAEHAADTGHPLRLVTVTDAATAGGRSRAQAVAQLARASVRATRELVAAFPVALEAPGEHAGTGALVRSIVTRPTVDLAGAELVVGDGWLGLRSHPRPAGSIVYGGPDLPDWFNEVLEEQCR